MERRRLLTLSIPSTSPGQRFRIQAWAPHLARHGIENTELPFASPRLENLLGQPGHVPAKLVHTVHSYACYAASRPDPAAYDLFFVHREATPFGPPLRERWIRRRSPAGFVLDIDDPLFIPETRSPTPFARVLRVGDKWKRLCDLADVTLCINEEIAAAISPCCRRVEIVPNALDLEQYPRRPSAPDTERPVLGYSGSHSTLPELLVIQNALRRLAREREVALHVLGGAAPFSIDGVKTIHHFWTPESEVRLLHQFIVGLAPAADTEYNRHKEFVKILLYMAVGLPVVASPVGSSARVIRHGVNGFLATSDDEWVEILRLLLSDSDLCLRIGSAARQTVEEDYALARHLPRIIRLFSDLARRADDAL